MAAISIHALRVEGDRHASRAASTLTISIHALRVEGDFSQLANQVFKCDISIHALRVEGDVITPTAWA